MDLFSKINLNSECQTVSFAEILSDIAQQGDIFALNGDLGAGKSVFARAFITARNGAPIEVPSPTFTLVQVYELASGIVHHFDLYRLDTSEDALELGLDEAFDMGISLIEWPVRAGNFLPLNHLEILLEYGQKDSERTAKIYGGPLWKQRLESVNFG